VVVQLDDLVPVERGEVRRPEMQGFCSGNRLRPLLRVCVLGTSLS